MQRSPISMSCVRTPRSDRFAMAVPAAKLPLSTTGIVRMHPESQGLERQVCRGRQIRQSLDAFRHNMRVPRLFDWSRGPSCTNAAPNSTAVDLIEAFALSTIAKRGRRRSVQSHHGNLIAFASHRASKFGIRGISATKTTLAPADVNCLTVDRKSALNALVWYASFPTRRR